MGIEEYLLAADEVVARILHQWDMSSTCIAAGLVAWVAYLVMSQKQPDTHPMLLARQSQPSPVRLPGESAVYRSHTSPHGLPLNTGLNVKDVGKNKWQPGRDGDLRDIWRRVVTGRLDEMGQPMGEKGRIITVLGNEQTIDHNLDDISKQINIIGQHIEKQNGSRVAIYLPNCLELLTTLFACAFYGLTPIILPYDQPASTVISMLEAANADTMIAAVGNLPFDAVTKEYSGLKALIWVTNPGNKHIDWDYVPTDGGPVYVTTYQKIILSATSATTELPAMSTTPAKAVLQFWLPESGEPGDLVSYSQANLVSAISAQLTNIPPLQKIGPSDLFLPVDSLASNYCLVLTLAALYYNASLALNSVAGREPDLEAATQGVSPTIIVASPHTLQRAHEGSSLGLSNGVRTFVHWLQTRQLTQTGVLPAATWLTKLNDGLKPSIGAKPGKLRLIFTAEQAGGNSPPLSALTLSDLRVFTGARVVYALTAPKVAGAITQTGLYDYRVKSGEGIGMSENQGVYSHFGAPMTSVEIFLKDTKHRKVTDENIVGEIVARGPAVVGGEAALGINGRINDDLTLSYL